MQKKRELYLYFLLPCRLAVDLLTLPVSRRYFRITGYFRFRFLFKVVFHVLRVLDIASNTWPSLICLASPCTSSVVSGCSCMLFSTPSDTDVQRPTTGPPIPCSLPFSTHISNIRRRGYQNYQRAQRPPIPSTNGCSHSGFLFLQFLGCRLMVNLILVGDPPDDTFAVGAG